MLTDQSHKPQKRSTAAVCSEQSYLPSVSDCLAGPYEWVHVIHPDGLNSFDMGVWQEDDGSAYLVRSVNNEYVGISPLSPDYTTTTGLVSTAPRVRQNAPAVVCIMQNPDCMAAVPATLVRLLEWPVALGCIAALVQKLNCKQLWSSMHRLGTWLLWLRWDVPVLSMTAPCCLIGYSLCSLAATRATPDVVTSTDIVSNLRCSV